VKRISLAATLLSVLALFFLVPGVNANTLQVGPSQQYAAPCAAIAAASSGDTIQIATSGNYSGDVCQWSTSNLTLIGVGPGRAVINAAGNNSEGKAIWVISGDNTTVENIEFTGATVPDMNGAGIRQEGSNLTIRNCYFHDNQDGILTDAGNSTILIEFSEFAHNGAGDGQTHNLYIGNITKLIFRYNYSHDSVVGHLLKSRAAENDILYNLLADGPSGSGSYELDLPNGGLSYVIGNLIEQGPQTQNSNILAYQEEGASSGNPSHQLFVVNNTFVNDYTNGTFVYIDSSVSVAAVIQNNIFEGPGTVTTQSGATLDTNFSGDAKLVDPTNFNYHLQSGSPAVDAGSAPGTNAGMSLAPAFQYVNNLCAEQRSVSGAAIDIGAYELNGGNGVPPPNAPSGCGSGAPPTPSASLAPANVPFGNQAVSTTSGQQPVSLSNNGNAPLTITGISITGIDITDFGQTNNCGSSLAAGSSCTINVTFTPGALGARGATLNVADNASGSPQTASLSGTGSSQRDFSVASSPTSGSINAGQPTNFGVTVTSMGGFNQAVSLACSGAPAGATCSPSTNSVTPSGSAAASAMVTITTTARSLSIPAWRVTPPALLGRMILPLLVLGALLPICMLARKKQNRFVLCSVTLMMLFATSCGVVTKSSGGTSSGGQTGTPVGTYTITVTATSGALSHTSTFSLTVN